MYFVCYYLNFNFNSIRQTIAISFFLLGYEHLVNKKWVKYYIYCLCAFMFHASAIICFIFPLFYLIKFKLKWFLVFIFSLLLVSVFAITRGGADILSNLLLNNTELMGMFVDNAEQLTELYFGEDANEYGVLNIFGIISMFMHTTPIVLVLIGAGKKTITLPEIGAPLILFFMILHLLDFIVPVIFMRFLMYLDIVYICALSDFVIDFPKKYIGRKTYFTKQSRIYK